MTELSILFVDDEDLIRQSFTRELREEHFAVTAVDSGDKAVDLLKNNRYDLVITDLLMPGIDGLGVLKAVKESTPQTSVIIITGYGDMHSAIEALRLGADDFAIKPCEIEEVVFRIRRCQEKQSLLQMLSAQNLKLEKEIAHRQKAEAELIESDTRFRLALDASSNGVWDRNLLTGEVYVGENWYRSLGYEDKKEINVEQSFENLLHPDDRERVLTLREEHIQGKTLLYEVEYRMRNKAGNWQWFLSRGRAVTRDEHGKALRIIGTHTDITHLKEMEAELKDAQTELENRVQERTRELSEANIALTVLLKKREEDRTILAEEVLANTTKLVEPLLDRLKESRLTEHQETLVDVLRSNIKEVTSPFANNFSTKLARLTSVEIQVANMVKMGKQTKEIAELMHLSPGTVNIHRKNIRKKLDMTHQKVNLQTTLSQNF